MNTLLVVVLLLMVLAVYAALVFGVVACTRWMLKREDEQKQSMASAMVPGILSWVGMDLWPYLFGAIDMKNNSEFWWHHVAWDLLMLGLAMFLWLLLRLRRKLRSKPLKT